MQALVLFLTACSHQLQSVFGLAAVNHRVLPLVRYPAHGHAAAAAAGAHLPAC